MDKYKFGEFIYTQRKKLGYTQDELGRKLKVTNKAVSKWETGETLPDIQLLPELASVLNVSLDELLTQRKVEPIKVYPKDRLKPILWIVAGVLLSTTLLLAAFILVSNNIKRKVDITTENAEEYFDITPCENFVVEGYGIDIYGRIKTDIDLVDPNLVVNFTVQYYYINTDGELSEVVYLDRHISYDPLTDEFCLVLRPKSQISNFKSFYSVEVSYEIVEASGRYVE